MKITSNLVYAVIFAILSAYNTYDVVMNSIDMLYDKEPETMRFFGVEMDFLLAYVLDLIFALITFWIFVISYRAYQKEKFMNPESHWSSER